MCKLKLFLLYFQIIGDAESDELKLLKMSKAKVGETELSKRSSDMKLVEALNIYEEKRDTFCTCEKDLKKWIDKSHKYFELKASQLKELKFLFTKIEGLKSCLKEAKLTFKRQNEKCHEEKRYTLIL